MVISYITYKYLWSHRGADRNSEKHEHHFLPFPSWNSAGCICPTVFSFNQTYYKFMVRELYFRYSKECQERKYATNQHSIKLIT